MTERWVCRGHNYHTKPYLALGHTIHTIHSLPLEKYINLAPNLLSYSLRKYSYMLSPHAGAILVKGDFWEWSKAHQCWWLSNAHHHGLTWNVVGFYRKRSDFYQKCGDFHWKCSYFLLEVSLKCWPPSSQCEWCWATPIQQPAAKDCSGICILRKEPQQTSPSRNFTQLETNSLLPCSAVSGATQFRQFRDFENAS